MSDAEIGTAGLALAGLLVAVAVAVSRWQHLGLERSLVGAALRALVQLLLVGVALRIMFADDTPLVVSWLWVAAMVGFGARTVGRRTPPGPAGATVAVLPLTLAAFAVALTVTLGVLFGLGVYQLRSRTLVPLAGMVIGNSIAATVLVARRLLEEFEDRRPEIEARLALGQSSTQAFRSSLRRSVRDALTPQVETTRAVGIVFLPGAMVGLILAGVDPLDAVRVQAAVMYMILASVSVTVTVVGVGVSRRLFTPDHRPLPRAAPSSSSERG